MGQKESKLQDPRGGVSAGGPSGSSSTGRNHGRSQSSNRNRLSRADLAGFLQATASGSGSQPDPPYERRETRQEREARKLEKERLLRAKERERSVKQEHVDGGYLVTLGTYTGPEDFSKPIVRQLQLERKLAPFWRGLNEYNAEWTEYQMICAARGLTIPAPGEPPTPEALAPRPAIPQAPSSHANSGPGSGSIQKLTLPLGPRSLSANSEQGGSNPTSPSASSHRSTLKTKGKALATTFISSRNSSQTDLLPREIALPGDNSVNGQTLEVALYKDVQECPICFLDYPPYLNRTRCCDQPICSECFVQIKRPDPHFPEHHGEGDTEPREPEIENQLVSEPATCPYCQAPEFGVTYEPPSFRRGLAYAPSLAAGSSMNASSSSLSTGNLGTSSQQQPVTRRRAQSLAANAPGVITTDHVRPDWKMKLEALRAHQARRAAAATALHTATYLMGGNSEGRSLFRSSRLGRRQTANQPSNPSISNEPSAHQSPPAVISQTSGSGGDPSARIGGGGIRGGFFNARQVEDLEELMLAEAMRLSLADEEERKRKAEREAKKKEEKEVQRSGSEAGPGPATLTRKRGNSAVGSNLRIEASVASAMNAEPSISPAMQDKGKSVERREVTDDSEEEGLGSSSSATVPSLPIPTTGPHGHGPSHLRQMSNASSVTSSLVDSVAASYTGTGANPRASGLSVNAEDGQREGSTPNEPMFNFRSLAEMVGVQIEGTRDEEESSDKQTRSGESAEEAGKKTSRPGSFGSSSNEPAEENSSTDPAHGNSDPDNSPTASPEVRVTPTTPATEEPNGDAKRLGNESGVISRHTEITQ